MYYKKEKVKNLDTVKRGYYWTSISILIGMTIKKTIDLTQPEGTVPQDAVKKTKEMSTICPKP